MSSKIKHYITYIASFQNGLHNPFLFKLVSILNTEYGNILNTESGNFLRNELLSLLILTILEIIAELQLPSHCQGPQTSLTL